MMNFDEEFSFTNTQQLSYAILEVAIESIAID